MATTATSADNRWSKQFGDFAEHLVMYLLGRHKGMKVALVDHTGADLIASDLETGKRYAVSVKGRHFPKSESKSMTFKSHDVDLLRDFADSFDLTPAVAFVFCDEIEEVAKTRVFICKLDTLESMAADDSVSCVGIAKEGGCHLKYWGAGSRHMCELRSRDDWDYTELTIDATESGLAI